MQQKVNDGKGAFLDQDPDPKFGERIAVDVFICPNYGTMIRTNVNAAYVYSWKRFPLRIPDQDQDQDLDKCERTLTQSLRLSIVGQSLS